METYNQAPSPRIQENPLKDELENLPEIDGKQITIAVYSFTDKTGQRKPADNIANLSSAVTQGAEVWVIDALGKAGNGTWFEVLERIGLDNLVKERQLIRNTREVYEKENPKGPTPLKPMKFAGLILEGGIIGYDSNVAVGGAGARYLGIGAQGEYRVDTVTVVMRIVSVSNGKVLLSVATEKSIASTRVGTDVFKFLDLGTKLIEAETGFSVNEPVNYAVRAAIEAGVVELIKDGERRGLWKFKHKVHAQEIKGDKSVKAPKVKPKVEKKIVVKPLKKITESISEEPKPIKQLPKSLKCHREIFAVTSRCVDSIEDLKVQTRHVDDIPNPELGLFSVCNKDNMCFRSAKDLYTYEAYVLYRDYQREKMNNFQR
jgi:curli production assembly/transport component CsgG